MTNSVKELVEAAKRAQVLLQCVTVRGVLEAGNDAIEAAGLNPYCVNEGRAYGSEPIGSWWLESAIAAVESEGDGWIEIKEGCEMPLIDENVLFWTANGYATSGSLRYYLRTPDFRTSSGSLIDGTHWQRIAPPTKEK